MRILTNFGARCSTALAQDPQLASFYSPQQLTIINSLAKGNPVGQQDQTAMAQLESKGIIKEVSETTDPGVVETMYAHNPLGRLENAVFEFTSRCNFSCAMCYNTPVKRTTENNVRALKSAGESLYMMGIKEFAFIGGEVSKFGDGWLELVSHLRSFEGTQVGVVTNGWFALETGALRAAGVEYSSRRQYLLALRDAGVTHVLFSIDGDREKHDAARGHPGLFDAVLSAMNEVRQAGMNPRVSLLVESKINVPLALMLARRLYDNSLDDEMLLRLLIRDRANILTNRIDIGNDANLNQGQVMTDSGLSVRCKGFFRPTTLTIKANGEIATCRLSNVGEGYGNLHDRGFVGVLNGMHESSILKLHATGLIDKYLPHLDQSVFGSSFKEFCTLVSAVTALAKEIEREQVLFDDAEGLRAANERAAKATGHGDLL